MHSIANAESAREALWAGLAAGPRLLAALVAVAAVLALLVPLPPLLVDLLLALSLGAAAGVLVVALAAREPVALSSMPPLLVLTSLGRIVLCLCVARLVLVSGDGGTLVPTLGLLAGAGDGVAGIGLLVVLAIVQVVMVTTGVGRMAEVAARFALDALPGKQMGLDTAVSAGHMSSGDARAEVQRLEREANFYGAMDGAGRLLRGEAVTAIVIVALTALVGVGRAIGDAAPLGEAARGYAVLATGHGLVTILPALVMAAATALMVSRSAGASPLVEELGQQMLVSPWPLVAGAVALVGLGLFPGVAKLPTLIGGALLAAAAWWLSRWGAGEGPPPPGEEPTRGRVAEPQAELALELGMGLLDLVERPEGLMEMLPAMRRRLSAQLGFSIPAIVVRDSLELGATEYAAAFRGGLLARGTIKPGRTLAVAPAAAATPDVGRPAELPDGRTGVWIAADEGDRLVQMGFTLMTAQEALVEHLAIALRRSAPEIFDLERAARLLDELRADHPALASAADAAGLSPALFRRVCGELLWGGIPLRDPLSVFEGVIEALPETDDPEELALRVRPRLAGMLSEHLATEGTIRAVLLAPALEEELANAAYREHGRTLAAMLPARSAAWVGLLDQVGREYGWGNPLPVVVEPSGVMALQSLCRQARPELIAVRGVDLSPRAEVEYVARLEPGQLA